MKTTSFKCPGFQFTKSFLANYSNVSHLRYHSFFLTHSCHFLLTLVKWIQWIIRQNMHFTKPLSHKKTIAASIDVTQSSQEQIKSNHASTPECVFLSILYTLYALRHRWVAVYWQLILFRQRKKQLSYS